MDPGVRRFRVAEVLGADGAVLYGWGVGEW